MGGRVLRGWDGVIHSLPAQEQAAVDVDRGRFVRGMTDLYRHNLLSNTTANGMTQSIALRTRSQISSRKREFLKNIVKDKGLTIHTSSFDRL